MNTTLLRVARRHFNSDLVPAQVNRANCRKWCRMVRLLGDKWVARPTLSRQEATVSTPI